MSDNLKLWNDVQKTDPKFTKKAKIAGGFEITAINATYQSKVITEQFGECGYGWGIKDQVFEVMPVSEEQKENVLCYHAKLWYKKGEKTCEIPIDSEIDIWSFSKKWKSWNKNNDMFKKVKTDAMTKGFSLLGISSDVFMGMYDDNKYVMQVAKDIEDEAKLKDLEKLTPEEQKLQKEKLEKEKKKTMEVSAFNTVKTMLKKCGIKEKYAADFKKHNKDEWIEIVTDDERFKNEFRVFLLAKIWEKDEERGIGLGKSEAGDIIKAYKEFYN